MNPAAAPGPLSYHDDTWQTQTAGNNFTHTSAVNDINARLALLGPQFALAENDRGRWFNRDTYDTNAALAARGIFNSGSRDQAFIDRGLENDRRVLDNRTQYGDIAQAALGRELWNANEEQRLLNEAAERQALQRGMDKAAGAAPVQPTVTAANNTGKLTGWTKGNAWFSRGKNRWAYIDQNGQWVDALKPPPASAKIITNPLRAY